MVVVAAGRRAASAAGGRRVALAAALHAHSGVVEVRVVLAAVAVHLRDPPQVVITRATAVDADVSANANVSAAEAAVKMTIISLS